MERLCLAQVHPPIAVERLRHDGAEATCRGRRARPVSGEDSAPLDFGEVVTGGTVTLPLLIECAGAGTLQVSIGSSHPAFAARPSTLDIMPGKSAIVTIAFTPSGAIPYAASLEVSSNDPTRPLTTIDLSGTGVPVAP